MTPALNRDESKSKVQFQVSSAHKSSDATPVARNVRRTTMRSIPVVTKSDVEQIATELRYRLRAKNIRATELDIYLFNESMKNEGHVNITEMIHQLQKLYS
jgi:hypothetical protein